MKVAFHLVQARREKIALLLQTHSYLPVADLCARFEISEATARRDLEYLERHQKITRTHGGALGDYAKTFASFAERQERATDGKSRIARLAVKQLTPGSTSFFDAGTTLLAVAKELAANPVGPLSIVTNSLPVAEVLGGASEVRVFLLGGEYLNRQAAFLGEKAQAALKLWKFDAAFLSGQGMTSKGIFNSLADVCRFQQALLKRSTRGFFCIDQTKLAQTAPALLTRWPAVDRLISDAPYAAFCDAGISLEKSQHLSA